MSDLVTIIIPTFNRAHTINRTLNSIFKQSHTNWECIVIDDGSTDDTLKIVEEQVRKDSRVKLFQRPQNRPKGANACRNLGLENAHGDYINFLDSDDTLHPDKLSIQIDAIKNTPYQFSVCQTMLIDDDSGHELGLRSSLVKAAHPIDDYITFRSFWTVHPPLYKSAFIQQYRFDESLQQSQEYEFTIRILSGQPVYHTTELVLAYLHIHANRMSSSVTNSISKIRSNLNVRLNCFKNSNINLLPSTHDHLYEYIFDFYKELILSKEWSKAWIAYVYLVRCSSFYFRLKRKRIQHLTRWFLALPSYYLSNRGTRFLRYIEYKS
ncbi:glycosyltransferase family 2 protein [Nonlabens sp. SY33080]|uniref:glycosyltransferase family 2 protein n=1 Tax=Nonlabens sp. SY33080 TaxID=2719911 RepID=UPI001428971C|nr:glycosyltransferase family 2 protein [Nonlabens sp. SY33080]